MDRRFNKVSIPKELTPELCEFVGAFIGDGFTDRGKVVALMGDSVLDSEYYKYMSNQTRKLFGLDAKLVKSNFSRAASLRFYSKPLCSFFYDRLGFPKKGKTYYAKIPEVILGSSKENRLALIRGIFDTDGCVFFDKRSSYPKPYPRITLSIANKDLAKQLVEILSNHFTVSNRNYEKKQKYFVEIYGHNQLQKWVDLIGFSNPRHLNKIKEAGGEI